MGKFYHRKVEALRFSQTFCSYNSGGCWLLPAQRNSRPACTRTSPCYASFMPSLQEQYDDAMFDFSTGDYDSAIAKLKVVLASDPAHFDAQLALGMAHYRKGDYKTAIEEAVSYTHLRAHETRHDL